MATVTVRTSFIKGALEYKSETTYTDTRWIELEDVPVPANSTVEIDLQLDVSEIKAWSILSTVAVTFKTNSSGSPDDTVALTANSPAIWPAYSGHTNPLDTDVTTAYLTNATGSAAVVNLRFLTDGTP